MLYRAAYAAAYDKQFKASGHHVVNIVLHMLANYLNKFNPEQVHVFWDSPRSNTWRKDMNPTYKDGRDGGTKVSASEISATINNLTEVGTFLFRNMGIQQYYRDNMEADDLIYAFCRMNDNDDIIIISSDTDLKQITYKFDNVRIHSSTSKSKGVFVETPKVDPVMIKCFVGDKSDNTGGYHRIGPVKAKVLAEDTQKRHEFLISDKAQARVGEEIKFVGAERLKRNLLLIDLHKQKKHHSERLN